MIEFRCPQCSHHYGVPDQRGGKSMVCSECGHGMKVPFQSVKDTAPEPTPSRTPWAVAGAALALFALLGGAVWWLVRR